MDGSNRLILHSSEELLIDRMPESAILIHATEAVATFVSDYGPMLSASKPIGTGCETSRQDGNRNRVAERDQRK